jgi:hypothetical protein
MNDVFISYASADRETAQKYADTLESFGWSVWWDREIPVGKTYDQVIEEELNAAACVVVLWSKNSVQSRWVKTEASAAADRDNLVPVLIDKVGIPLEFRRIQTANLSDWNGDESNPEFLKLRHAVEEMVGRRTADPKPARQKQPVTIRTAPWRSRSTAIIGASVLLLLVLSVGAAVVLKRSPRPSEDSKQSQTGASSATASTPALPDPGAAVQPSRTSTDVTKSAGVKNAFRIAIGDKIDDGVPARGAGVIATPFAQDNYTFSAAPGQRVYFRMFRYSNGLAQITWRLIDPDGNEVFNTCLGCTEPGVQNLKKGGTYTLTVGSERDPATGTYQLQLFDVPATNRFAIKIGDQIKDNVPGAGAGVIESPGAEDIYTFSATARQRVYFRMHEHSTGMAQIGWKLTDPNGAEVFNTCFGCSEPGVQTLIGAGTYTLTVGSRTVPATGSYRIQLFDVPAPNQFTIKIGDRIKQGVPGPGAGVIEVPGAEDIYVFSASAGQKVYFHLIEHSPNTTYVNWRLQDDNGMELFNTCFGCSEPGVQTLIKGGQYTLTIGNKTNPGTGTYAFETGAR